MTLVTWSWLFLVLYIGAMLAIGYLGGRRVKHADDFATARGSYGPLWLAFAFAATTASGATFLGGPGLAYMWGAPTIWGNFLYPIGVYFGVLICMRLIATSGNRFGNRSIPEYLGDRYQSDGIRVIVSVFSLVLFFYIVGQLVSGLVMFEIMLGMDPLVALIVTSAVLVIYVFMGGAHADILTDGVQGIMMLILAAVVIVLFVFGVGVDGGGMMGVFDNLKDQDHNLVGLLNTTTPLYHSWWSIACIVVAHLPLGLLPHLGNKLWALKNTGQQRSFIKLAFTFGITLGMLGLGGLLARAMLGDSLDNQNQALPMLFIELFPPWLAALIGVGILAAIMSTADGLVVSSSQVIANDLYRRTLAKWLAPNATEEQRDRQELVISRWATVVVMIICTGLAWLLIDWNVALIVWIGIGGMMAAFAGPLVMGALWKGVTRTGAYAGLISGFVTFVVLHDQWLSPDWLDGGVLDTVITWLHGEGPNPFSCSAIGEGVGVLFTLVVSKLTAPLPTEHLDAMFHAPEESPAS
ncbi:MAG: sodium:solute symporter family protein [Gammaproteobacteria bacterium]|nr:sodium:solute symporter family protein [Gammaproteobacteria bacterium]